ncbi:GMC family oxidoreductase [Pontibacillus chungwhensis BH030062]|uniref:GMC family oxidoreductase n=1 Tax=Pontibacillus chungwhensis BH030062 TaxID=1385513 RepID=A0A0A2V1L4_9BACI|nr:GMC family oxidoreductase [Pontibacillus chungwhensis]KGP92706.1 GMC family oxidoreductase [Pontibacillus chungwhensis BH030062]
MAKTLPKVDVVTVGVGWTGGILAAELAKDGMKVVGLERGKERSTEDYLHGHDELRYALRYELMQDTSKETITFRNNRKQRALPMRQLGSFLLGENLGGAGVHWNGQTYRFFPYDFEIKSMTEKKYGKGKIKDGYFVQDWGITYDELEPYYDQFEKACGISGEENPMAGKRSNPYPTPPMKSTRSLDKFAEATKELGYKPYRIPSANLSEPYKNQYGLQINACQYCAFCERFGCEYGAKSDPVISVIPAAQESGNYEIRYHSNVTEVIYDGSKVTGVKYVDVQSGEEFIQPAEVVALTSYVMNNVKFLLMSDIGQKYDPKSGQGVVGRSYCYQILPGATGFYEEEQFNTFMGAGALGTSINDYYGDNFDHSELDFIHGGVISITQTGKRPIANNPTPPDTPRWGKEFKSNSIKYYTRTLTIGSQGASLPYKENFLDLDPTYKDAYGLPLLRMTYNFTDQDKKLQKYITQKTAEISEKMGASKTVPNPELTDYSIVPYQTTHNTGGAIMGADPNSSVVNSYLQHWNAENLFVVGASAFAHNGGVNPTDTVGALAYRAAEGIKKYRKNGGSLV